MSEMLTVLGVEGCSHMTLVFEKLPMGMALTRRRYASSGLLISSITGNASRAALVSLNHFSAVLIHIPVKACFFIDRYCFSVTLRRTPQSPINASLITCARMSKGVPVIRITASQSATWSPYSEYSFRHGWELLWSRRRR